jgi:chromosome segregation ATPase
MANRRRGRIALTVIGLIAFASLFKAVSAERDKRRLADAYEEAQQLVQQLSDERSQLSTQLANVRQTVEEQAGDLASLQQELTGVQQRLDQALVQVASLRQEQDQLREQNATLVEDLALTQSERDQLEARMSSLKELKLAIRDVKRKLRAERWASWQEHIRVSKVADQQELADGNRGLVVRNGKTTLGAAAVRMHVHVLEPQTQ